MTLVISKGLTLDNGTRAAAIAGVSPTLDYRFAREKREIEAVSLTDKLTYTGGNGTFVGSDGFIQPATTNVPRFDHDPLSRRSLGLLSEVERTNGNPNSAGVGAVAGTPGATPTLWPVSSSGNGVTREVVGFGSEAGISYIDIRFFGTPTGGTNVQIAFSGTDTIAALPSQTWTLSGYVKLQSGSLANTDTAFSMLTVNSGAGVQNLVQTLTAGSGLLIASRQVFTTTVSSSTITHIQPRIRIGYTTGSAFDLTLRVGLPQMELGATASSVIPTTSAAVTRTADSAVIDGTGVITGTYTMVEKPAGCAVVSGTNINLQPGFTAERVMVFPAALDAGQITAIRGAM